jgi:uncharacterized protein (DUF433 family)
LTRISRQTSRRRWQNMRLQTCIVTVGLASRTGQERCMDALLVSRDPEVMSGALCFRGTRVPVKNLFDYLEGSSTLEDFLGDFPSISRATAVSVLEAARERLALDATAA